MVYLASDQTSPYIRLKVIAFIAKHPSGPDHFGIGVAGGYLGFFNLPKWVIKYDSSSIIAALTGC